MELHPSAPRRHSGVSDPHLPSSPIVLSPRVWGELPSQPASMVIAPRMERAPGERSTGICGFHTGRILRLCRNPCSLGHVMALGVATPVCFALWILKGSEHVGWALAALSSTLSFSSVSSPSLVRSSISALVFPHSVRFAI